MSWNGATGIPFEWASLSSSEQAALDTGDASLTASRLTYLRGDRSNEITPAGAGLYRDRLSVLGDIIDSSPTWVGPPSNTFTALWADALHAGAAMPENSGQTYTAYIAAEKTRTNVVYTGANDGMLHGFRTGSFNSSGSYDGTYNDGYEVMAYVPGYVVNHINISTDASLDYSNYQYGHRFDVDAQPGTGDLYYAGAWHTWLVGGLGPGGAAIYALDITNPGTGSTDGFSESTAANTVIGEWSTTPTGTTLTCATDTGSSKCGINLGNTYGTPELHRFHNGTWGAVFGNGFGSSTGDAGIYVMLVNASTGAPTFYYLSTGTAGSGNGIAYTTAADLDGDTVVDYIYAGDLLGNVWRFDLTSATPSSWAVRPNPLFTTLSGQPITTKLIVASVSSSPTSRVMVEFGTGQQTPLTNTSAATYKTTQQYLYGIWDWDLATWNAESSTQYAALPRGTIAKPAQPNPPAAAISGTANLQAQSITGTYSSSSTATTSAYRTVSSSTVCYADTVGCTQYGWYLPLTYGYANPMDGNAPNLNSNTTNAIVYEQVIYNPSLALGAFVVNTAIPPVTSLATCSSTSAGGWTMAINPATGGAFLSTSTFFVNPNSTTTSVNSNLTVTDSNANTQAVSGLALGGTGSLSVVSAGSSNTGSNGLVVTPNGLKTFKIKNVSLQGGRVTWIQKR
jgi:type IV pilus assembly protein PilY1